MISPSSARTRYARSGGWPLREQPVSVITVGGGISRGQQVALAHVSARGGADVYFPAPPETFIVPIRRAGR
jgi:hypothetical protein